MNMQTKQLITQISDYFEPAKMKLPLLLSAIGVPFITLFEKYIFSDWEFLFFLFVLVSLDTATGMWKHWMRGTVSSQGFGGVIVKTAVYGVFLIVLHVFVSFPKKPLITDLFVWLENFGYGAIIVREGISIVENLNAIKPGLIPVWLTKRLKDFDETGKLPTNTPEHGQQSAPTPEQ